MFKDFAIILDAIQRSFLTKSATAIMFALVQSILHCHLSRRHLPAPFHPKIEKTT